MNHLVAEKLGRTGQRECPGMHRSAALALALSLLVLQLLSRLRRKPRPWHRPRPNPTHAGRVHEHDSSLGRYRRNRNEGNVSVFHSGDFGPGQPPLDDRTMFQIGSLTKTFTATLLASMVLDGRVKLDQAVQSVAPSGVRIPSYRGQRLRLQISPNTTRGCRDYRRICPAIPATRMRRTRPALFAQFLFGYT